MRSGGGWLAIIAVALLAACNSPEPTTGSAVGICGAVEYPLIQSGGHLLPTSTEPPVSYSSTPATSGWHTSGNPKRGIISPPAALTDPEIVTVLEAGSVVAAYDPAHLSASDIAALQEFALTGMPGFLTVTQYVAAALDAPLILNAWGIRTACPRWDEASVRQFITEHRGAIAPPEESLLG